MEIKKQFLQKYLHLIAIDQITEDYTQRGYKVFKEERLGKYQADLIARKDNETIVIEVKSGKMTPQKKEVITELGNYVRQQGNFKFLIVIATPPKEKKLKIVEIEQILFDYFLDEFPDDLIELSTHTRLEEITDIDIDEIIIEGKEIFIKGDGVVEIELQYGSDGDQAIGDGFSTYDNYPFTFEMTLEYDDNNKLKIANVDELEVDTSSFYE